MKLFSVLILLWFSCFQLCAQIVLPDFVGEDGRDGGPEARVQVPDEGGAHSQTDGVEEEIPGSEELERQMREMMQAMQVRRPRSGAERNEGDANESGLKSGQDFIGGPESLSLELEHEDGRRMRLEIPNQTLRLKTAVGDMPFRLHEVAEMRTNEAGFELSFRDGDRARGHLDRVQIPLNREESEAEARTYRGFPLEKVRLIRIGLSE